MSLLIETERLIIRELEKSDSKDFIDMESDGTLSIIFDEWETCAEWMDDWIAEAKKLYLVNNPYKEYLAYAIAEKETGKVIGAVGCSAYEDLNEIGITYFIGSKYRNVGYAAEATKAFTQYFLEDYKDINHIIATVHPDNIPSCRTVEKAGYNLMKRIMYKDIYDDESKEYKLYLYEKKCIY
ncbi:GNAT family N-acetyltransferase [Clostridium sardiniense]|uniref:GNAT family N-acetyltransferase n=1 Tax=Clostridium sardiniense TaxID=29369 RepID=UPI003D328041